MLLYEVLIEAQLQPLHLLLSQNKNHEVKTFETIGHIQIIIVNFLNSNNKNYKNCQIAFPGCKYDDLAQVTRQHHANFRLDHLTRDSQLFSSIDIKKLKELKHIKNKGNRA